MTLYGTGARRTALTRLKVSVHIQAGKVSKTATSCSARFYSRTERSLATLAQKVRLVISRQRLEQRRSPYR
jgi:hypothetical protein